MSTEAEMKNRKVKMAKLRTRYTKEAMEKKVPVKAYVDKKMASFKKSMTPFNVEIKTKANNVKKTDNKPIQKTKRIVEEIKKQVASKASLKDKIKTNAVKAGDTKKNKAPKSTTSDFEKYSSISAAKAAGSMYYKDKQGNKKAAVTSSDLEKSGLSLRDYMNMKLGKTRKKMSTGGALKATPASNTGLKKLPTSVRNKMGYMSKGGTPKKANKGMLVITIGSAKKMKKKK